MEKYQLEGEVMKQRRNTSFCKTLKKDDLLDHCQLPLQHIHEVKTVKAFNKKVSKIPFLNMANLRHAQRPRGLTTDHKPLGKLHTERDSSNEGIYNASFFWQESQLKLSQKNFNCKERVESQTNRKQCLLPPIEQHKLTSNLHLQKPLENLENFGETRRRKSKLNIYCKVLLAKNNQFPFIGSHHHENRKAQSVSSKQTRESQGSQNNGENPQIFDLNISRINQVQEPPSPAFISRQSFNEIAIF